MSNLSKMAAAWVTVQMAEAALQRTIDEAGLPYEGILSPLEDGMSETWDRIVAAHEAAVEGRAA